MQVSSQSSAWPPLASILVEPKAHVRCGDFDKMVIMQVAASLTLSTLFFEEGVSLTDLSIPAVSKGIAGMGILAVICICNCRLQLMYGASSLYVLLLFICYLPVHVDKFLTKLAKSWHDLSRVACTRVLWGTARQLLCCQACMSHKHFKLDECTGCGGSKGS